MPFLPMNILLAGASGYAGQAIAGNLRQAGHHVTARCATLVASKLTEILNHW